MRRALVGFWVVALATGFLVIDLADTASAHPGIENPYVPAGVLTTVALGVPSELPSPMVEIDVTLPPDFTLRRVDPSPGWQETTSGDTLRFFAGNVPQGGYAQFTFAGVFAQKRVVSLPVITRAADGTTVNWDQPQGGALPAAVVLPGYSPGSAPSAGLLGTTSSTGGGSRTLLVVAVMAAGLGVAGWLAASAVRRRRTPGVIGE